ncbi:MAG: bifunctional methylenetetrahydrofolate dehydrogenase/methenyltetrahydrofolate cyclohydrolase [Ancylobacter novellus]|uniref:Bifunctional protein FolD n=1 Tax=Ancylobacter novellus TaxID=921 RepID=A0A2W5KT12_ANCNO|nr:MAG: bifunctional methylenetetrahydrofolate dehydrogenase/methenyltetrahydrofolate cyclohydrolase [Ancylobacter novellus]
MTAQIIDGRAEADKLLADVKLAVARLKRDAVIAPCLAVVLVGDDPASEIYVRSKTQSATAVGIRSMKHVLPVSVTQAELLELIDSLNEDEAVHGILVQLPLPPHLSTDCILSRIVREKDVDGFHPANAGSLSVGKPTIVPCTPLGCLKLVKSVRSDLTGLDVVVVGHSRIVGRPAAQVFLNENCSVTVTHKESRDVPGYCREADILVVAVGRPHLIKGDWIKPGATVIDVGINRMASGDAGRIVGDVEFDAALAVAGAITPVPGGVGPMTVAALMSNTVACATGFAMAQVVRHDLEPTGETVFV